MEDILLRIDQSDGHFQHPNRKHWSSINLQVIDGTFQQKQWLLKWYSILKIILVKSCTQSSMVSMTVFVARDVLASNALAIEPSTSVPNTCHVYPYHQLLVWATRYYIALTFGTPHLKVFTLPRQRRRLNKAQSFVVNSIIKLPVAINQH